VIRTLFLSAVSAFAVGCASNAPTPPAPKPVFHTIVTEQEHPPLSITVVRPKHPEPAIIVTDKLSVGETVVRDDAGRVIKRIPAREVSRTVTGKNPTDLAEAKKLAKATREEFRKDFNALSGTGVNAVDLTVIYPHRKMRFHDHEAGQPCNSRCKDVDVPPADAPIRIDP